MADKTKKPTGLKIAVDGSKFVCTWKIADANYTNGQHLEYKMGGKWTKAPSNKIKPKTVKFVKTFDKDDYYPTTYTSKGKTKTRPKLTSFQFRVKGNRASYKKKKKKINPGWSNFNIKELTITPPPKPKVTAALDEEIVNRCKFSWTVDTSNTAKIFTDVEYESILVPSSQIDVKDLGKLKWKSSTKGYRHAVGLSANSSVNIDEANDFVYDETKAWARVFRARSRGPAGVVKNPWVYKYHVYAYSNAPTIKESKIVERSAGYLVGVKWSSPANKTKPIDRTVVEYAKVAPRANMSLPAGFDSWQTAGTLKDTSGSNALTFSVDGKLEEDQCLFVRVVNHHDSNVTESDPVIVLTGSLKQPTVEWSRNEGSGHSITVTAESKADVPDADTVILYRPESDPEKAVIVGVIAHGDESSKVMPCPDWSEERSFAIGYYAAVGTYESDGDFYQVVEELMKSAEAWSGGSVSLEPPPISVEQAGTPGTARVVWGWTWPEATGAQIAWADHEDAWESTDEPETYDVSVAHAPQWNVSGLEVGTTWYFRVRLYQESGDAVTYGPWSETYPFVLSSAPAIPSIYLSTGFLTEGEDVTVYWAFVSTDGSGQAGAEVTVMEMGESGYEPVGDPIPTESGAQYMTLNSTEMGWTAGNEYRLAVRLVAGSGERTRWSVPAAVYVAAPIVATINSTSLEEYTDGEGDEAVTGPALRRLPLELNVTGAGEGGSVDIIIERASDFHMDRPDERTYDGYRGEAVVLKHVEGEGDIDIELADVTGVLDDTADYQIIARVTNAYRTGDETYVRTDESDPVPFTVHWEHQAISREALAECVAVEMYKGVPKITLTQPAEGYEEGDTVNIYRLSADRPELIYEGAVFGDTYVDPYPAIGEKGGHRIVYMTANGDYTSEDGRMAWLDLDEEDGDLFESDRSIIDFGLDRVELYYNVDVSSSWQKDFKRTVYLGGSVQGDWNPGVTRDTSINVVTIPLIEQDTIDAMRRLADYPDICHVRTVDGSSFAADVQVSENREHDDRGMLVSFELETQKVDAQEPEGMTFERWSELYDRVIMPDGDAVLMPDGYVMAVDVVED